ncbi:MAG TPA: maltose ABC transporter permease MalG [Chthoniobacterales bacterium]|nr:maltose ABC transporter permease MalG [Chthoniobacterales bacterium]
MQPGTRLLVRKSIAHAVLITVCAVVLIPFAMVVLASFRKGNFPPSTLWLNPAQWTLEHWKYVLGIPYREVLNATTGETKLVSPTVAPLHWFLNSLLVSSIASFGIILLSGTAAYAFSRLRFWCRSQILTGLLVLQMFPQVLTLTAYYRILDYIGQHFPWLGLNTFPGLILIYLSGISINIWMIKGYFDTISPTMEDSARIDGASRFKAFVSILLPMSAPIFAVVFILSFISMISEYPTASVVLQESANRTLAVGAFSLLDEHEKLWGHFSALAVLSGVPITIMFLLCQRFIIGGLTAGGAKE